MELQPDFKELLELLNAHGVDYLIVGGYALAFLGAPRFTGDLDIFIKTSPEKFIQNKRASGRLKYLADIEALQDGDED